MNTPNIVHTYAIDYLPNNDGKSEDQFMDTIGLGDKGRLYLKTNDGWDALPHSTEMIKTLPSLDKTKTVPDEFYHYSYKAEENLFDIDGDHVADHLLSKAEYGPDPVYDVYAITENLDILHNAGLELGEPKYNTFIPPVRSSPKVKPRTTRYYPEASFDVNKDGKPDTVFVEQDLKIKRRKELQVENEIRTYLTPLDTFLTPKTGD